MKQRWLGALVRSAANALMGAGVIVFGLSLVLSTGILMEGVTRRSGEGQVEPPEWPEQVRHRLAVVGGLVGAAVVGWALARLGDSYRKPEAQPRRPRVTRLAAELLLFLGGIGLWAAVLVGWGHRLAAYEVPQDYDRVGIGAAVGGPVFLALGWALYRRSARGLGQ